MKRTPKQQRAGVKRLNAAFGGWALIYEAYKANQETKKTPRRNRKHLRRRVQRKYAEG